MLVWKRLTIDTWIIWIVFNRNLKSGGIFLSLALSSLQFYNSFVYQISLWFCNKLHHIKTENSHNFTCLFFILYPTFIFNWITLDSYYLKCIGNRTKFRICFTLKILGLLRFSCYKLWALINRLMLLFLFWCGLFINPCAFSKIAWVYGGIWKFFRLDWRLHRN